MRAPGPAIAWLLLTAGCVDLTSPSELTAMRDAGYPRPRSEAGPGAPSGGSPTDPLPADAALPIEDTAPASPADAGAPEGATADPAPAPDAPAAAEDAAPDGAPPAPLPPAADAAPPDLAPPDPAPAPADAAADVDPGEPDAGTPALPIDDFERTGVTLGSSNPLGGIVDWDNQNVTISSGELRVQHTGAGGFQDFIETLRGSYCPRDVTAYRALRFRMRASSPGKRVAIYAKVSTEACDTTATPLLATITVGTTMATHEIGLGAIDRTAASAFEWSPPPDATVYFLDDIELVP